MRNVSLKVLVKSLKFLFKKGYEPWNDKKPSYLFLSNIPGSSCFSKLLLKASKTSWAFNERGIF